MSGEASNFIPSISRDFKTARGADLFCYLIVPVVLAFFQGVSGAGTPVFESRMTYFAYHLTLTLPGFWLMGLATWMFATLLRRWKPNFVVICALGALLGSHFAHPLTLIRHAVFRPYLSPGSDFYVSFPWRYGDLDFVIEMLLNLPIAMMIWAGLNLYVLRVWNVSRFGYEPPEPDARSQPVADQGSDNSENEAVPAAFPSQNKFVDEALIQRLPAAIRGVIIALEAEEHYTRVYTEHGNDLVLIRFGDAVAALSHVPGMRVHRSYWISLPHVASIDKSNSKVIALLNDGTKIPVSRTYRVGFAKALEERDESDSRGSST